MVRLTNKHEQHLSVLDDIARNLKPVGKARIASALVYKNSIVAVGFNRYKTHPFQSKYSANSASIYLHAENDVIVKALKILTPKEISKSTLYISRMKFVESNSPDMVRGLSKPCCGCMASLAAFSISKVCYTCDDGSYDWL
jgi:hypothetical protein